MYSLSELSMVVLRSDGSLPSVINESTSSFVYMQLISTCLPSSRDITSLSSSIFTDIPWSSSAKVVSDIGLIIFYREQNASITAEYQ